MNRVKTKPKKRKITLGDTELNKLKRDITKTATDKACLIVLAAMVDELHVDDTQLCSVMERTDRYAGYIDNHKAKMEDIRKTIQSGTGIRLEGW
jgi:hypothetical protein|nr:MAG TPA: hypothetical protein [Caudoviricetes sp.]